ncbi:MmgE/PrpD family protein [Ramlibacter sp. AN1133]|uniref:MmgE/PrpD family protein n=1 Tax=Ramlibacter sp. AN1133 TaxID=3133429 RepID=UPI0030C4E3EF
MLAARLGAFAAQVSMERVPASVRHAARLRVLDTLGAGLAGVQLGNHLPLAALLESSGTMQVWGERWTRSAREAALVNSFAVHSTYLEDGSRYTGGHPSAVVIPAVLAMGQARRASGKEMLAATLAGYEVFLRLGRAVYPACVRLGFQSTAILGAVSSAAAIARLLGLNAEAAGHAIAIGASLGSGFKESLKTPQTQPLQVARGCEAGILAALLAQQGQPGAPAVIERGLLPGFGGRISGEDEASVLAGLGVDYLLPQTYFKRHAGCRGNHAPVDAALDLALAEKLTAGDVASVRVGVDSVTRAAAIEPPRDGKQAQMSVGFSVALALLKGHASVYDYTDAVLNDPALRELMQRIEVGVDPKLDAGYPQRRGAWVEVTLRSGKELRGTVPNARGEPECPLTEQEVREKFRTLAAPRIGARTNALEQAVLALEDTDGEALAALLALQDK